MKKNQTDYRPNLDAINKLLDGSGVITTKLYPNAKASEYYIRTIFTQDNHFRWETVVPYIYRRSGLNLKNDKEIAEYLRSIKKYFTRERMNDWKKTEWSKWEKKKESKKNPNELVTILFFKVLLSFKEEVEFPTNPNPQRRFQDIKDSGYIISIFPIGKRQYAKILLPIPIHPSMKYEVFSTQFKSRVIRLFNSINAYEAKKTAIKSLIPDHKFSEVRWDDQTEAENPMDMTDDEIKEKFQLLDNQRNQQKREICRNCYQTGERGKLFGIDFYPQGDSVWNKNTPIKGKVAEEGCKGCPWYDIETWRKAINKKLKK